MNFAYRWRKCALAILIVVSLDSCLLASENETLEQAVSWLVSQQDQTGAFKSKRYGAMKQGAAITSLVLYSLTGLPEEFRSDQPATVKSKHAETIQNAFDFLLTGTKKRGQVANPDGSLDHPVYSTAMFLVAAKRKDLELDRELVRSLLKFLVESQCTELRGFEADDPNYGGWDVLGPAVMPGKTSGTNVSVSRFVLEAFESWVPFDGRPDSEIVNTATAESVNASRAKAKTWIRRLHAKSSHGGFVFTAQPGSALNKSKGPNENPRSYSSATCDGFLVTSLVTDGWSEEYLKSLGWLFKNIEAGEVAGFEDDASGWAEALCFYHWQSLGKVCSIRVNSVETDWFERMKKEIQSTLAGRQKEDGRFENESALMRENDPLIATSFAIIALSSVTP